MPKKRTSPSAASTTTATSAYSATTASVESHEGDAHVASTYRSAVSSVVMAGARLLASPASGTVGRKRLINFLRGSQLPIADAQGATRDDLFGLLESHSAAWLDGLIEGLLSEGYLSLEARARGLAPGLAVTAAGRKALSDGTPFPASIVPRRPRLGSNVEVEEKLRGLRREIAAVEGRVPFGVFPNQVLAALAHERPRSLAELASIPGLGEARVRKYGRRILHVIGARGG